MRLSLDFGLLNLIKITRKFLFNYLKPFPNFRKLFFLKCGKSGRIFFFKFLCLNVSFFTLTSSNKQMSLERTYYCSITFYSDFQRLNLILFT